MTMSTLLGQCTPYEPRLFQTEAESCCDASVIGWPVRELEKELQPLHIDLVCEDVATPPKLRHEILAIRLQLKRLTSSLSQHASRCPRFRER